MPMEVIWVCTSVDNYGMGEAIAYAIPDMKQDAHLLAVK